jgi:hypothetical protein
MTISDEIALTAYQSAEYKKALAALGSGVERDFRIAEGVSPLGLNWSEDGSSFARMPALA